jgi:imidazole glycerol-phosphate synthase subunit HisF
MLKTRLIARMDIKGPNLIKPINLEGLRVVGDPQHYAEKYSDEGIDEILFMDAVASLYGRNSLESLVRHASENCFIPMTVGGGIRSHEDAQRMLYAGADKVAINTAAVKNPELITEIANRCGSQAMVLQVDAKRKGNGWEAYIDGGREHTGRDAVEWIHEGIERGAGEILLTSIDREGTRQGFDLDLIRAVKVSVPVIASGGAGATRHMIEAIDVGADAIAIADVLHFNRIPLYQIRSDLSQANIPMRLS